MWNVTRLIDRVLQETGALTAELVRSAPRGVPLGPLLERFSHGLVGGLLARGFSQPLVADMLGITTRALQARLYQGAAGEGQQRTLWLAVLSALDADASLDSGELARRFQREDPRILAAVLRDLVAQGLVSVTGRATQRRYARVAGMAGESDAQRLRGLVWVAAYHLAPTTAEALGEALNVPVADVLSALAGLEGEGHVQRDGERYSSAVYTLDTEQGWEGAVYDHLHALLTALRTKLRGSSRAGGSTWRFEVWPGHPLEAEVHALLAQTRARVSDLRSRVDAHNQTAPRPAEQERVVFYAGQHAESGGERGEK